MAMEKGSAEDGTSSSLASNDHVLQAESPHNSENQMCPICLDIINNPVSVSWCSHAFCFPCILEWSCNRPVCPICREPFRYLLRKVGDNSYEVYSIGHYISSRYNRGRRNRRHSADRRRHHSADHGHHRSPSRERGNSRARDWERDRSRTRRWNSDGHSRGQQTQSFDPSSSRRWQHSRARDTASETPRGWHRAARRERDDVPVGLGRSARRQWAQRDPYRESLATSRRSHRFRRTSHTSEQYRERRLQALVGCKAVNHHAENTLDLPQRLCQPVPLEKCDDFRTLLFGVETLSCNLYYPPCKRQAGTTAPLTDHGICVITKEHDLSSTQQAPTAAREMWLAY